VSAREVQKDLQFGRTWGSTECGTAGERMVVLLEGCRSSFSARVERCTRRTTLKRCGYQVRPRHAQDGDRRDGGKASKESVSCHQVLRANEKSTPGAAMPAMWVKPASRDEELADFVMIAEEGRPEEEGSEGEGEDDARHVRHSG
jgi:hypothetical protein